MRKLLIPAFAISTLAGLAVLGAVGAENYIIKRLLELWEGIGTRKGRTFDKLLVKRGLQSLRLPMLTLLLRYSKLIAADAPVSKWKPLYDRLMGKKLHEKFNMQPLENFVFPG